MTKNAKLFILIGVVSLALGLGVGYLVKYGFGKKTESVTIDLPDLPQLDAPESITIEIEQ
ncbi:MAG: hypothetical protein ACK4VI_01460 [Alphaproteobacteria bacterium]